MRPDDRRYLESHEWALKEEKLFVVGITDHAVANLSDLVYVDLPEVGLDVKKGEPFGEIESVKSVSDLYSPLSGEIVEVHEEIADKLDLLAKDPYGKGWLVKINPSHPEEFETLLDARAYEKLLEREKA